MVIQPLPLAQAVPLMVKELALPQTVNYILKMKEITLQDLWALEQTDLRAQEEYMK